jgi:hypothetical protein
MRGALSGFATSWRRSRSHWHWASVTQLQPTSRELSGHDYANEFTSIMFNKQARHCAFPTEIQTDISMISVLISAHQDGAKGVMAEKFCPSCEWPSEFKLGLCRRKFWQ